MKYLRNQDGIALVIALMFTMLILGIIMTLLYYVSQGTKMSAAQKRYKNSLEASYGGTEFVTKAVLPRLFTNDTTASVFNAKITSLTADFGASSQLGLWTGPNLKEKITKNTALWGGSLRKTVNPKESPDLKFTLKGTTAGEDFTVYGKIVDTTTGVGLIDATGIDYLDAGIGVAGASNSTKTLRTPNIYSIEIQGEKAVNPTEKAGLSVLYAY